MIPYFIKQSNLVEMLNMNVYLSNILLLPSIIFIYLIINEINNWNIDNYNCKFFYMYMWIFVLVTYTFAFIISTIYHYFMFSDNKFLKLVGKLDYKITAPLLTIVVIILSILYYNTYLFDKNNNYWIIFILSVIFNLTGLSLYFCREYILLPKIKNNKDLIIYLINHICFHYVTYTGILLITVLLYLHYENIYKCIYID